MTRLRVTFLALALLLLLPLGLLVGRALVSLANERELRHQIVAERIFDEMERELTALGAESRSDRASKISQSVARNVMPYSEGEEQEPFRRELEINEKSRAAVWEALDVVLESLVGRRLGERHLVLYRSAVIDAATYRQGFVVDADRLIQWLAAAVLEGSRACDSCEGYARSE